VSGLCNIIAKLHAFDQRYALLILQAVVAAAAVNYPLNDHHASAGK